MAIKLIDNQSNWFSLTEFRREISVMSLLIHENLIPFYGACTKSNDYLAIVTQFIPTGSLRDLLKVSLFIWDMSHYQNPKITLNYSSSLRIALEVAKGMVFIYVVITTFM